MKILSFLLVLTISSPLWAAPIDWHGSFAADSYRLNNFKLNSGGAAGDGSQVPSAITGDPEKASFQSYLLKLNPSLIINDVVTLKGEILNGYGRGGFMGDSGTKEQSGNTLANGLYYHNTTNSDASLFLGQIYANIYSDLGTFKIGRFARHWGLGAIYNDGTQDWDRHYSSADGVEASFKVGNFAFKPFWAKASNGNTAASRDDVRDYGVSGLYDNADKEMAFGVLFSKRSSDLYADDYNTSDLTGTTQAFGRGVIKLWDIFLKKRFNDLEIAAEGALFSGEIGNVYGTGEDINYKASAMLGEAKYQLSPRWSTGLKAGQVSGHDGKRSSFSAMYLHPNYQIASILFRYNREAMGDSSKNIYDSYVTNTQFAKFYVEYLGEKWNINTAFIYAKALEVAKNGGNAFNHEKNKEFTAAADQKDDYGMEIDFSMSYNWNSNVAVKLDAAYLQTGDYYAFSNDASNPASAESTYLIGGGININF